MTNLFKGLSKDEKKRVRQLIKIMSCDLDCDNCKKTLQECVRDTRSCVNILLKDKYKKFNKNKEKRSSKNSMVS